jgi:hypothetical protein
MDEKMGVSDNKGQNPPEVFQDLDELLSETKTENADEDFNDYINKSLSMVLHHDDIKKMIEVVKKVSHDRQNISS